MIFNLNYLILKNNFYDKIYPILEQTRENPFDKMVYKQKLRRQTEISRRNPSKNCLTIISIYELFGVSKLQNHLQEICRALLYPRS